MVMLDPRKRVVSLCDVGPRMRVASLGDAGAYNEVLLRPNLYQRTKMQHLWSKRQQLSGQTEDEDSHQMVVKKCGDAGA